MLGEIGVKIRRKKQEKRRKPGASSNVIPVAAA
jgi:hypothetical protein